MVQPGDLAKISEEIKEYYPRTRDWMDQLSSVIVGQVDFLEKLMMAVLADGHILVEGVPGLAKTLAVKTLSDTCESQMKRIQFTPDVLPADITGTLIYNQKNGEFEARKGPVFANIILADEINRAPAKVQSALLEAMEEKQVTIGDKSFKLDDFFVVIATQNPIEQEGTYTLPEAQMDRFLMKVLLQYPSKREEEMIINLMSQEEKPSAQKTVYLDDIFKMRHLVSQIYVDDKVKKYILDIVFATRFPEEYRLEEIRPMIRNGISTRGTLSLIRTARVQAFLKGRSYVIPEDVKRVAFDVLRHRLILSFEALAEGVSIEELLTKVMEEIQVP